MDRYGPWPNSLGDDGLRSAVPVQHASNDAPRRERFVAMQPEELFNERMFRGAHESEAYVVTERTNASPY